MDRAEFGPAGVAATFRYLVPTNRLFGGVRPLLGFLEKERRGWEAGRLYRLLDVGCGAGDVAVALIRWARRRGLRLQVEALDRNPATVAYARPRCRPYPEILLRCGDVLDIEGPACDYLHASQFLHHFPDQAVPRLLQHLLGLCREKVVINDLRRARPAYAATWLYTLFTSPVFRHDARLSVRKGFDLMELARLLREGGFRFRLERHFFYRFLLIVEHPCTSALPA